MPSPSPSADRPALVTRGVGVSFGGLRALDDVSIEVARGEIVGIIGPNGAGKTTLFDCISGFLRCDGTVEVAGVDVTGKIPNARAAAGLGRSFQDARLFPTMTVLDAIRVACELHRHRAGVVGHERRATATALELVDAFGLQRYRDKLIRELSTGTRRIVDMACVVAQNPAVVLLDEPSSGIAQREAEALGPLLRRLRDTTGCAMVLIEHDMPLLLGVAERVYALETGRVIAAGVPSDVVNHPEVIRSYLGADPAAINRSGSVEAPSQTPRARARAKTAAKTPKAAAKTSRKRTSAGRKPTAERPRVGAKAAAKTAARPRRTSGKSA